MSLSVWFVGRETPSLCSTEPTTADSRSAAWRCELMYLNEGGANVVFRILPPAQAELPRLLQRKLLRLGKHLSHVRSAEEQLHAMDTNFTTLFPPDHLVQHELISLDTGIPLALNVMLAAVARPKQRREDLLPRQAMSGMLVTDMTPESGEILLQLKPKWLAQSPNAPPAAKRCRTCAVRAHRASERICTATDAQQSCPLNLVSVKSAQRTAAVHAITPDAIIRDYLLMQAQPLLQQLRKCQTEFDQHGVLKTSGTTSISSLCKAMTLRDCTLFVKRAGTTVEARLGDLDLKHPEKFAKWMKVEANLISGGWYTNTEHQNHHVHEEICLLSR